ncbi:hypothetical protein PTTG_08006 [Puccinia triticina 1-1 BBBD Race 1]|uniref:Vacuolar ATPase assembly integral membrane protein VMA21 n=2 Tax=Puccinia triticina TaxID=208348 RepID=A0A0C4F4G6_PUCT1|nr:uncharacterized protein PtA15_12A11 [Puccinia triticina]OAV88461.1 hypothetical protein PTTG_08006 [Puccinia triticina 1-1 BBBD Race 1]WAQ90026.1 hypothetical protein PtA15_12A11 [Puccinia triticina]WAR61328.1 hypothetical protein PtB15_12B13 [Puccinia triticina]
MSTSENKLRQRKHDDKNPAPSDQDSRAASGGRTLVGSDYNRPIFKLGIVSLSMAILPIGTYFGTLGHVFEESNTTAAAISAIVVTNIILIGYVLTALSESDDDQKGTTNKKDLQNKKDS